MLDPDELAAWLRLTHTPGIGLVTARAWLAAFGSPQAVVAATIAERRDIAGPRAAATLVRPDVAADDLLGRTRDWLRTAPDDRPRDVVPLGDPRYPAALLHTCDPPLLLYTDGDATRLNADLSVAIVGSRHATPQGLATASAFAIALSAAGVTVVSGLAVGIDGAAHDGAVAQRGGTVAVVGTGLDRIYPARHAGLAGRIAQNGVIASEQPLGAPPLPAHFPQRNRLIAGMTRGTLVVEAALASGTLITARLAAEANRDVFAVPGSVQSLQSRGCHALIKQGAQLVESPDDLLAEYGLAAGASPQSTAGRRPGRFTGDPRLAPLLTALGHDPVDLDTLCQRTGEPAHTVSGQLLELELSGAIARLPGQRFQRL